MPHHDHVLAATGLHADTLHGLRKPMEPIVRSGADGILKAPLRLQMKFYFQRIACHLCSVLWCRNVSQFGYVDMVNATLP